MIDQKEEVLLAQKIRQGDSAALDKMITANLRFVVSVAKHFQNQGASLGELIQYGNEGLIKAANRFDETKGFKFISYAVWWIRQRILQGIAEDSRIVHLPLNQIGAITKAKRIASELAQRLDREPTMEELSMEMGVNTEKLMESLGHSHHTISFDAPLKTGEEGTLYDITDNDDITPDQGLMVESLKTKIEALLVTLPERHRQILILNFGLHGETPLPLDDIGELFDLTRERVRQIRERALGMLRPKAQRHLRDYR